MVTVMLRKACVKETIFKFCLLAFFVSFARFLSRITVAYQAAHRIGK